VSDAFYGQLAQRRIIPQPSQPHEIADEQQREVVSEHSPRKGLQTAISWRSTLSTLIAAAFAATLPLSLRFSSDFELSKSGESRSAILVVATLGAGLVTAIVVALRFEAWMERPEVSTWPFIVILGLYSLAAFTAIQPISAYTEPAPENADLSAPAPVGPCDSFNLSPESGWNWFDDGPRGMNADYVAEGTFNNSLGWTYHVFVVNAEPDVPWETDSWIWYRHTIEVDGSYGDAWIWRHRRISMTLGNGETLYFVAIKNGSSSTLFPTYWLQLEEWMEVQKVYQAPGGSPTPVAEGPLLRTNFPESNETFKVCHSFIPEEEGTPLPISTPTS
jgi:hypothetical protein